MATDLNGHDLTEVLSFGIDPNSPYTNTGATEATLTLQLDSAGVVYEGEADNFINQTAQKILLVVEGTNPGVGFLEILRAANFTGGTLLVNGSVDVEDPLSLGSGGIEMRGISELGSAGFLVGGATLSQTLAIDSAANAIFFAGNNAEFALNGPLIFENGQSSNLNFGIEADDGLIDFAPTGVLGTFSGEILVSDGTLMLGSAEAAQIFGSAAGGVLIGETETFSGSSTPTITTTAATLDLGGQANVKAANLKSTSAGVITTDDALAACNLTVIGAANSDFLGIIRDGGGKVSLALNKTAGASFTLGDDDTYSGGTTIKAGVLNIAKSGSLGSGTLSFAAAGGTLDALNGFNLSNDINIAAGVGAYFGEVNGQSLSLDSSDSAAFSVGAGAFVHFGGPGETGAIYLDPSSAQPVGANATLDVDGGFLLPQDAFGAQTIGEFANVNVGTDINTFAVLDINGFATTLNNLSGDARGNLQNSGAQAAVLKLNNTINTTFDGNIHGDGPGLSVKILGDATLSLSDDNTYTGGTTINAGATLSVGTGGTTGSIIDNVNDNGTLVFNHSGPFSFGGAISGSGVVASVGPGVLTLSGNNSFAGGLELSAGVVSLTSATAAGKGPIVFESHSAVLRLATGNLPANPLLGLKQGDMISLVGVKANSAADEGGNLVVRKGGVNVASFLLAKSNPLEFQTVDNGNATLVYADVNVAKFAGLQSQIDTAHSGFVIDGAATALNANMSALLADPHLVRIVVDDNAPLQLSATQAAAALGKLVNADGSPGKAAIVDTDANIGASFGTLVGFASQIASVSFTDPTPPVITLTDAQVTADAALLNEIGGKWVLNDEHTDATFATLGHGNKLVINDTPGDDTITGGGAHETFEFVKGFGHASLTDFSSHLADVGPDLIVASKSEFGDFPGLLLDAKNAGGNVVITAGPDVLTLDNMNKGMLRAASGDFSFV